MPRPSAGRAPLAHSTTYDLPLPSTHYLQEAINASPFSRTCAACPQYYLRLAFTFHALLTGGDQCLALQQDVRRLPTVLLTTCLYLPRITYRRRSMPRPSAGRAPLAHSTTYDLPLPSTHYLQEAINASPVSRTCAACPQYYLRLAFTFHALLTGGDQCLARQQDVRRLPTVLLTTCLYL